MTCTAKHIVSQLGESRREEGRRLLHRAADRVALKRNIRATIARIGVGRYPELEKWLRDGLRQPLTVEQCLAGETEKEPPQLVLYDLNRLLVAVEMEIQREQRTYRPFPGGG